MNLSDEEAPLAAKDSGSSALPHMPKKSTVPRITALGGGHGLAVVLQGLANQKSGPNPVGEELPPLTAIVTVADDGGSSGALRRALKIQAVGDIRNCLLALSNGDPTLRELFDFRFKAGLDRHSLGNLILAALTLLEKDVASAAERAGKLLAIQGQVIPATGANIELLAEFDDGNMVMGESKITPDSRRIRKLSLLPADAQALPSALHAIATSDLIVIGPGSVYTSLIPILLLDGIVQAIARSGAHVVLVMNLMTEINETLDYSAVDILSALQDHAPNLPIHTILINDEEFPKATLKNYRGNGAIPIASDPLLLKAMGSETVFGPLLARGRKIRHDPEKLARALLPLASKPPLGHPANRRSHAVTPAAHT